ncbi:MAG: class I SAM-dependent methyltransferase [Candidatus Hodarchaeota archaeon]
MDKEIEAWERNYSKGRYNKWPHDLVVSNIMRRFGKKERENVKILDLGCGGGNNLIFISEEGFDAYGIDGSPSSIEITKQRLKEKNLNATVKRANFKEIPFDTNYFNCVIDRASIYCNFWSDIEKIVDEIFRILRVGGIYLGFLPTNNHPAKEFGEMVETNTYSNFSRGTYSNSDIAHFFTKEEIETLFNKFKIKTLGEHSIKYITNNTNDLGEFSEYILVAEK